MAIPSDRILRAAVRWLELLPHSSPARCRALFTTHTDYSDITPTQYELAYVWLREAGLLRDPERSRSVELRVFSAAMSSSPAAWFADADILVREPSELPADALRVADLLGFSAEEAHGEIVAMWGKVDLERRQQVGAAGELALVKLLAKYVPARVDHVAAVSDGHGYDIAVHTAPLATHLEVKSTLRRGRLTIHLSRHEFETMRRDAQWLLVAVRLTSELVPAAIATVPSDWISANVPVDHTISGRWEACRLEAPPEVLQPGIPALAGIPADNCSALLTGEIRWPG
ncbi:protein of unknown function [Lentzea waywayandensis]|uniref:Protein NO VEIN C-terminal domain-containing protein n=1 Tax=Lentzea waywayandensis TaxID=84724 RepID=A0A1I6F2P6_9PSEU|nr:DUF3883 domain-containing protein [Lentzea waywayandensis]SFR24275.1 protein of unknown function [Lentzea waywayandensis]